MSRANVSFVNRLCSLLCATNQHETAAEFILKNFNGMALDKTTFKLIETIAREEPRNSFLPAIEDLAVNSSNTDPINLLHAHILV